MGSPHTPQTPAAGRTLSVAITRAGAVSEVLSVFFPLILALGFGFYAREFLIGAIKTNLALNGKILVVIALGVVGLCWIIAHLKRERAAAVAWFASQSSTELHAAWLCRHGKTLCGAALERLRGADPGVNLRKELAEHESSVLDKAFEHRQELIGYLVGGCVALGLLGTFIGLLQTLTQMSSFVANMVSGMSGGGDIDKAVTGLVSDLRGPLNSMGSAFSASMLGVVGSVLLGLMLVLLRRHTNHFGEAFRSDVLKWAVQTGEPEATPALTEEFLRNFLADLVSANRNQSALLEQVLVEAQRGALQFNGVMGRMERILQITEQNFDKRAELLSGMLEHVARSGGLLEQQLAQLGGIREDLGALMDASNEAADRVSEVSERIGQASAMAEREIPALGQHLGAHLDALRLESSDQMATMQAAVVHAIHLNSGAYLEAAVAMHSLPDRIRDLERALLAAEKHQAQREHQILNSHAALVESGQLLKDTLMRLAAIQEDVLRKELASLMGVALELRSNSSGNGVVLQALDARLADANGLLGEQLQLLENLRSQADSIRMYAAHANGNGRAG